jgi:hypothetical protein
MRGINKPTQIALGMSVTGLLCAAEPEVPQGLESLPDMPEPSARVQSGEALEPPDVRIVPKKDVTIEEYRIRGRLYHDLEGYRFCRLRWPTFIRLASIPPALHRRIW